MGATRATGKGKRKRKSGPISKNDAHRPTNFLGTMQAIPHGPGIANLGNSCFMAAALQCLFHTAPLLRAVRNYHCPCKSCWICTFKNYIDKAINPASKPKPFYPYDFYEKLKDFSFPPRTQQDSHDFMTQFLGKLGKVTTTEGKYVVANEFGGTLINQITCLVCGLISGDPEKMLHIALPLVNSHSIEESFNIFTQTEYLDSKSLCEFCQEQRYKTKSYIIGRTPNILVLQLLRYQYEKQTNGMVKLTHPVEYSSTIDISKFTRQANVKCEYEMYAMIVHEGSHLNSGHYIAYVRCSKEKWFCFNDSEVSAISEQEVLSKQPYVIFYAKESVALFSELMKPEPEVIDLDSKSEDQALLADLKKLKPKQKSKIIDLDRIIGSERKDQDLIKPKPEPEVIDLDSKSEDQALLADLKKLKPRQKSKIIDLDRIIGSERKDQDLIKPKPEIIDVDTVDSERKDQVEVIELD
ncbi:ubiquitin carboxyl-terminal hydrolase 20-like [Vicia villosa]|uniref:ubiquitin carboxyl-terminal hydrolase 20-like n=1 Tax=Vicia villosa TaxID=3911 RepID=UPI00273A7E85|nr:ubiquitin carboxyl-terminal hydrolase 20-like [Vicia villosa]